MKIAVVCANGKEGQLIVKEAIARGFDVTAFVRGENKSEAKKFVSKDAFTLNAADFADFDVVVDAFGAWTAETIPGIAKEMKVLGAALDGTKKRLVVVGGAGSLFVNKEHTLTVADGADFPESWKPLAASHAEGLEYLRGTKNLEWTYISPAADFQAEGEHTGSYILASEDFTVNEKGESKISYADFAIALVDEIEKGNHLRERISVLAK